MMQSTQKHFMQKISPEYFYIVPLNGVQFQRFTELEITIFYLAGACR